MTQYDQPRFGDFGSTPPAPHAEGMTRVSILAISSLVTGILSFVACCVPVVGLVPAGLGIGALFGIQRSRGAVVGRGLAIAGLTLGVLAMVVSSGLWIGASAVGGRIGPVYSQAFSADPSVVRTVLTSSAAAKVSPERIAEFQKALTEAHGGFVEIPGGLVPFYLAYGKTGRDPRPLTENVTDRGGTVFPFPAQMGNGWDLIVVVMSPAEKLGSGLPGLMDIAFVGSDGKLVWLLGDSSAAPAESASPPSPPTDEGIDTPAPDPGA